MDKTKPIKEAIKKKKPSKELLNFNVFDSDDDEEDEAETEKHVVAEDDSDEETEKYHKPSDDLAVASDESDFEDEEDATAGGVQKITLNMLRQWELQLNKTNVSIDTVRQFIQAFNSALASISADNEGEQANAGAYKVVGAAAFNGVIQLCVLHLQPAIIRVLGVKPNSSLPLHKHKKWVKVRGCLRYYLGDLIRLVEQVSSSNILNVLLKHLHQMAGMVAPFTALGKSILKRLIVLWATGDETVRVLAFLCILKITRKQQGTMLNHVLKAMYLAYVRNSKFVSPNTLPGINFMRRSLVEMFALDLNVTYQHAFLYIRQLAIHLRNAVILKKKDSFQAVYNWQYVNSLRLWTDLLGATANKPQLQPLIYPLVTISTGVVRLIPTAQYFPLRFHCLQALITLSKETHTYIPVLPFIVEVLRSNTFNRKHTTVSMNPLQFTCILRLNKGQLAENGFRDEVVEQVCGLLLEYLAHESAGLAFSDLVVPVIMAIKAYLKDCRNANYARKLNQLLDKIQESSRFIEQHRVKSNINLELKDTQGVLAWEQQIRNKRTPLDIYYASWLKTHETKKRRQAAQSDDINADYDVPKLKRPAAKTGVPKRNEQGELELFPSDSEDDDDVDMPLVDYDYSQEEEEIEEPQPKKSKRKQEQKQQQQQEAPTEPADDYDEAGAAVDIVKDLDLNDW
ncbi:CG9246 [Drosophila busckii]|uniref:CG9246 n=1 Tax=Drosophila busckii TaxID=30019 RepID=A0A0M4E6T1_DROBS|nr:CG9246 [Drosophila busckii]